jgi:hydrogenase maturation factor/polyhydroxyalkanoate synthesis regulator phasin
MSRQKTKKRGKHKLKDKKLFLNYAMPCMVERVRRGEFTQEEFEKFCEDLVKEKDIPDEEMYNLFPIAMNFIDDSAKKLDKIKKDEVTVDKEVIRQYFWYDHDSVVKSRMNPDREKYCLILPGKVKKVKGKEGIIKTPKGQRKVSLAFLGKQDKLEDKHVTIHYYHACEIISEEEFNKLWEMKR